jgi:hypothetical protein
MPSTKEKLILAKKQWAIKKKKFRKLIHNTIFLAWLYIRDHLVPLDTTLAIVEDSNLKISGTNVMMKAFQDLMVSMAHLVNKPIYCFIKRECRSLQYERYKKKNLRLKLWNNLKSKQIKKLKGLTVSKLIYRLHRRVLRIK